jgi:phosphoribosyl 1,2-cyclic phosphodiesterase
MSDSFRIRLKFWGVRGSTPTPQIENLNYGGNTSCLEVRLPGGDIYVFDGGSGLRNLGNRLVEEANGQDLKVNFFLTHFHWDHIQGIPFFAPLYSPNNHVHFYSSYGKGSIQEVLEGQMAKPYFPVNFESVAAHREFEELDSKPVRHEKITIHPFPLNHPQGAVGYRIEAGGAVVVYATDLEHGHRRLDSVLRDYSQDADILIYDAQFTPSEYETHQGWGHSTWAEAIRVAKDTKAQQLILFHHDPSHDDNTMLNIIHEARLQFEDTAGAWEGWVAAL